MFILLISNRTVFLVQFEINLHLRVFEELARANYFQIELETVWLPPLINAEDLPKVSGIETGAKRGKVTRYLVKVTEVIETFHFLKTF